MPVSLSDFINKVNTRVAPSGAVFIAVLNSDGLSVKIYRAPNAASAGLPLTQIPVYAARVIWQYFEDKVLIGDGSAEAVGDATSYINNLN